MAVGTAPPGGRVSRLVAATVAAVRAWGRVLATSAGLAGVAGASQLGLAYGLQLVRFRRDFPSSGVWASQLTWAAWFATLAVVAGAAGGVWMARRLGRGRAGRLQLGQRVAVALAASLGAMPTVALIALPAREAGLAGADPGLEAALAASLGLVAGILAAVAALSLRVVAVSVTAMIAVVWLVALVSVAPTLGPTAEPELIRLGVLDLAVFGAGGRSTVAAVSLPAVALLVGVAVAAAARSLGLPLVRTILSGAAGPALLVLPYLIAPPRGGQDPVQAAAFGGAVIAVFAGLLAAVAVAVFRLPGRGGPDAAAVEGGDAYADGGGAGAVPAPDDHRYGGYGAAGFGWATEPDTGAVAADTPPPGPSDYATDPAIPRPRAFNEDLAPAADPAEVDDLPAAGTGDRGTSWPPVTAPHVGTPALETPTTHTPVAGTPPTGSPARPRVTELSAPAAPPAPAPAPAPPEPAPAPAPPEPAPAPAPPEPAAAPAAPEAAPPPAATPEQERSGAPPRRRRRQERQEEDHVDWLRSLSGADDDPPELGTGRRRLRQDKNTFASDDDLDFDPELRLPGRYGRNSDDG
jgi:hypothetical protein